MTKKTKAELDTLFADNSTGAISETDLRDFVDSIMGVYGGIEIVNNATGQTVAAGTPEKLTGWTHDGLSNGVTPAYASSQITIDHAGDYEVCFQVSFEGVTGDTFQFHLYKNNSPMTPNVGCWRKTSGTDIGSASFIVQVTLAPTDAMTIEIESDGAGTPVIKEAQFMVKRIG